MRFLCLVLFSLLPVLASAQDTPTVSIELEQTETVVGQPLIVRMKVLVPTFSPSPPEFPTLEVPGLLVKLPERASGPISETVNGESWSGVQRSYRVYPLRPGTFEIPAQTVRVTYAAPGGIDPISVDLESDAIRFDATVPAEAADLSPLIIANAFSLSQTLETPETFEIGSSVTRTVEAKISGTTPILIPQLIPGDTPPTLRAYPRDPQVVDSEERGVLSGTRTETVTYLGAAPGDASLPDIEIDWFNLQSGAVETVRLEGASLVVPETNNAQATPRSRLAWIAVSLGCLVLVGGVFYVLRPTFHTWFTAIQLRWVSSEVYAARQVRAAIAQRNLSETYTALEDWHLHFPDAPDVPLTDALVQVGGQVYARTGNRAAPPWNSLSQQFSKLRKQVHANRKRHKKDLALPHLNEP